MVLFTIVRNCPIVSGMGKRMGTFFSTVLVVGHSEPGTHQYTMKDE
jgi:hypothetical protein